MSYNGPVPQNTLPMRIHMESGRREGSSHPSLPQAGKMMVINKVMLTSKFLSPYLFLPPCEGFSFCQEDHNDIIHDKSIFYSHEQTTSLPSMGVLSIMRYVRSIRLLTSRGLPVHPHHSFSSTDLK